MSRGGWPVAVAAGIAAVTLGAGVAVAGVAVHRMALAGVPTGLLLALLTSFAVANAMRGSRTGNLLPAYAAGWIATLGVILAGRGEGDYAVAGDLHGYTLLAGAACLLVWGIVSRGRSRDTAEDPETGKATAG